MPSTFVAQALILRADANDVNGIYQAMLSSIISLTKNKNAFYCVVKFIDIISENQKMEIAGIVSEDTKIVESKEGFLILKKLFKNLKSRELLLKLKSGIEEVLGSGNKGNNYKKLLNCVNDNLNARKFIPLLR